MTSNKKDFHFDFNEDADPVDELHRLRVATSRHYKTAEAYWEHLRKVPTAKEILARLNAEIARRNAKAASARKSPVTRRQSPAPHRRRAAAHA